MERISAAPARLAVLHWISTGLGMPLSAAATLSASSTVSASTLISMHSNEIEAAVAFVRCSAQRASSAFTYSQDAKGLPSTTRLSTSLSESSPARQSDMAPPGKATRGELMSFARGEIERFLRRDEVVAPWTASGQLLRSGIRCRNCIVLA